MPATLNPDGTFAKRPAIGEHFLQLGGEVFTVAASWPGGVVFEGGKPCSAADLVDRYDPQCPECRAFHEPDYPHELTPAFRLHIQWQHGRPATREDTFAHCGGVIRAAVETACA